MTSRAYLTFVAIDRDNRRMPIPGLILETEEEKRKAAEADKRRAERLKARKDLEARDTATASSLDRAISAGSAAYFWKNCAFTGMKFFHFSGRLVEGEDRLDGTRRDAGAAVDALVRMDEELFDGRELGLVFARMDAVHRAHVHARGVLGSDAGFCDDVGHAITI